MKILVSGATGFVGQALCGALSSRHKVYGTTRHANSVLPHNVSAVFWNGNAKSLDALPEVDAVVHLAARVHVMKEQSANPLAEFRASNVNMTRDLAQWAAARKVKRFVFISSIKVNGEETSSGKMFSAEDKPAPEDAYAVSKLEAELAVKAICADTGLEFVVIRPPLVYGPGVGGNFRTLLRWMQKGLPLPLGAINNRRSLVALDNLVDLIATCVEHPAAANQTFLVSDGEDMSTTDLLKRMRKAFGRPARLIPVPQRLLTLAAKMLGKPDIAQRLCGSLQVDIAKTRELLGWSPPISVNEGLRRTAEHWLTTHA